jgi:hypothetical protein
MSPAISDLVRYLIKRLAEEMVIARVTQTAGEASPDQLVFEAVQAFIAKRKGERPANRQKFAARTAHRGRSCGFSGRWNQAPTR